MTVSLDLAVLRAANSHRQTLWCPDAKAQPSASFRSNELGGETAEALSEALDQVLTLNILSVATGNLANTVKKLDRERGGWRGSKSSKDALRKELGDVLISLDLVAQKFDIDLSEATIEKFNETSAKHGFPVMITPTEAVTFMGEVTTNSPTVEKLEVLYKNHEGEVGERRLIPTGIHYGTNEYHHSSCWMITAYDTDKNSFRTYPIDNIHGRDAPVPVNEAESEHEA